MAQRERGKMREGMIMIDKPIILVDGNVNRYGL
jgi:hypothetical protein